MNAMPLMLVVLCVLAIAYRYYSAFLAARVATLDDSRQTPAERLNDGQNYHPTSKWVLFGHHFAAISGAGPLIGPVLAAQFGYMPGLIWIVVGVCLGGAVQDFLVLAASIRRGGKSLAQIAFGEIGPIAGWAAMAAILFIVVIALAGLGKVVVKALGGEEAKYPAGSVLITNIPSYPPELAKQFDPEVTTDGQFKYHVPSGSQLRSPDNQTMTFTEEFDLRSPVRMQSVSKVPDGPITVAISPTAVRLMRGSSWGVFTIACTIPIALFVGFYMYRIRKGATVEASIIGGILTLGATVLGGVVANHEIGHWFNLTANQVVYAMAIYGFVAAVLPVWVLLAPRDYLSSFLKIGTIAVLVIGTLIANPKLQAPAFNGVFLRGGPTVNGHIFPFLFITIMCGAISGFHSLVSSGTTPKMIRKESHARTIGYGAMLIEGLVGVVAMIAASTLPPQDYYAMNTDLSAVPKWHDQILQVGGGNGIEHINMYEQRTQESLRGRTGGAVTLAIGMAEIFDKALHTGEWLWKYWYHFAIMFEALFILTTIDAGTRIGRFLLQELFGKIHPKFGQTDWLPGAILSTILIVAGWSYFLLAPGNSFAAIWSMFGIANQMLAVIALSILTAVLANEGKIQYLWVTGGPMIVVATTTTTAALELLSRHWYTIKTQLEKAAGPDHATVINSIISGGFILAMLACAYIVIAGAAAVVMRRTRAPAALRPGLDAAT